MIILHFHLSPQFTYELFHIIILQAIEKMIKNIQLLFVQEQDGTNTVKKEVNILKMQ